MVTIQEYKNYIWRKYKLGEITENDILVAKPIANNPNWNTALKEAQRWVISETISEAAEEAPSKSGVGVNNNPSGNAVKKILEPEIAKAIIRTDKQAKLKAGARPKDDFQKSYPKYMGKRLH